MLSNLPPGCTDKDIEDQCEDACEDCGGEGRIGIFSGRHKDVQTCAKCDGSGVEPRKTRLADYATKDDE